MPLDSADCPGAVQPAHACCRHPPLPVFKSLHACPAADLASRQLGGEPARTLAGFLQDEGLSVTTATVDVDYSYWPAYAVLQVRRHMMVALPTADAAQPAVLAAACPVCALSASLWPLMFQQALLRASSVSCSGCCLRAWRCPALLRAWATSHTSTCGRSYCLSSTSLARWGVVGQGGQRV